ncbi:ATP-binding protein [Pseudomonas sp. JL2]|uniref:ATP-binding protein n=1 Tax=Pseudomonas sp. JL2 TaxID=2919942 RepID=UPI002859D87D|nr:ATP-binding protein [Pseudomonas sp. JL2]MDR8387477.1 ATP-binding protein [Pseudomonas sp. JL2]
MMLSMQARAPHKGFYLAGDVELKNPVTVLTGKNGSGKTRLLESIEDGATVVVLEGESLARADILLVGLNSFQPTFGAGDVIENYEDYINKTIDYFEGNREKFNAPGSSLAITAVTRQRRIGGASHHDIEWLCEMLSKKLEKPVSALTSVDLRLFFFESEKQLFGSVDFSKVCNNYLRGINANKFQVYLHGIGEGVAGYTPEEYLRVCGEKPWIVIDEIIGRLFKGKFKIKFPDENARVYEYVVSLIEVSSGLAVSIRDLSSGEKTILWMVLSLYNSHFRDKVNAIPPKLILLDEPDAFLHPSMVSEMYAVLETIADKFGSYIIFTTHSPTTVALSPHESLYVVGDNKLDLEDKDHAISVLLDGVTQISIDPNNRREVFVENKNDADVYQSIFSSLKTRSSLIDPKISLSFIPAGGKAPEDLLRAGLRTFFDIEITKDDGRFSEFYEYVNGGGGYGPVKGIVDSLCAKGSRTVRGIVDWDRRNKPTENVAVHASDYAYTLENVMLDPLCIVYLLHANWPKRYKFEMFCGKCVVLHEWQSNVGLLQRTIDAFILKVMGRESRRDVDVEYVSGRVFKGDSEYYLCNGHMLKDKIVYHYECLKRFNSREGDFLREIAEKMAYSLGENFIPATLEKVLAELQK